MVVSPTHVAGRGPDRISVPTWYVDVWSKAFGNESKCHNMQWNARIFFCDNSNTHVMFSKHCLRLGFNLLLFMSLSFSLLLLSLSLSVLCDTFQSNRP